MIVHAQAYASCFAKDDSICRGFVWLVAGRKDGPARGWRGADWVRMYTIAGTNTHLYTAHITQDNEVEMSK